MEDNKIVKRKNNKIFNNLKCLKSNLCAFICKDGINNYDYASYDQNSKEINRQSPNVIAKILRGNDTRQSADDLERYISPRAHTHSRSRLPIYYKSTNQNFEQLSCIDKECAEQPWHSTKLDNNCTKARQKASDNDYSLFGQQLETLESEFDSDESHQEKTLFPSFCSSPESIPNSDSPTSSLNETTTELSSNSSSDASKDLFVATVDTIFACCMDYEAQHEGDICVKVSDRVHVIYDAGTEFVLVKHIRTQKCGYIPRICVLNVNKFLANLN